MTLSLLLVPLHTVKKSQLQEKRKQLQKSFLLKQSLHTNKIIGENNNYFLLGARAKKKSHRRYHKFSQKIPLYLRNFCFEIPHEERIRAPGFRGKKLPGCTGNNNEVRRKYCGQSPNLARFLSFSVPYNSKAFAKRLLFLAAHLPRGLVE